jgi:hypothetical protein
MGRLGALAAFGLLPFAVGISSQGAAASPHATNAAVERGTTTVLTVEETETVINSLTAETGKMPTRLEVIDRVMSSAKSSTVLIELRDSSVSPDPADVSPGASETTVGFQNSSKCSGRVCHWISGLKEYVSSWVTAAYQYYGDPVVCNPTVRFLENGYIMETNHFTTGCITAPYGVQEVYTSSLTCAPLFFNPWDIVCNSYTPAPPLSGQPCSVIIP